MLFGGDFLYTMISLSIITVELQMNALEKKYFRTSYVLC